MLQFGIEELWLALERLNQLDNVVEILSLDTGVDFELGTVGLRAFPETISSPDC